MGTRSRWSRTRPGRTSSLSGASGYTPPPPPSGDFLLLESGDYVLLESGDKILLES